MRKMVIFFLINILNCSAQSAVEITKIQSKASAYDQFLETDEYGYNYFLKNNVLIKVNENENFEFKNVALGKATRIDLHNPLKIVLFYENFNTAISLDNQLNESNNINFSLFTTPIFATAIGIASQNRLWIFNSLSQKIGLFDFLNNSYTELTPPLQISKKTYDSDFNTFYWVDSDNMLNSCDVFGKIATLGQIKEFDKIQILNSQKVLILKNNNLFINNLINNSLEKIIIDEKTIENFSLKNQILTIFTNQELHIYKIKLP